MTERQGASRGLIWVLAVAGAALVAVLAYNAGVSAGASQGSAEAARWHAHHWYFPFGPFFLILLIFWTMGMFRRAIWGWGSYGRRWGRHGYHPGWDGPWDLEEWHRRAHANDPSLKNETTPPSSSNA